MKKQLGPFVFVVVMLCSIAAIGGSLSAFIQPDGRVPYFGVRGLHEAIYDGIELMVEWEVGQFTFIEPRPLRDLPFYIFQVQPRAQIMITGGWWFGVSMFGQYRTNHPGKIVMQPEVFIRHDW